MALVECEKGGFNLMLADRPIEYIFGNEKIPMRRIMISASALLITFASDSKADPPKPAAAAITPAASITDLSKCPTEAECLSACTSGDVPACYQRGQHRMASLAQPSEQDILSLADVLRIACDKGAYRACSDLGKLYSQRGLTLRDPTLSASYNERSVSLLSAACDTNDLKACDELGDVYLKGKSVPEDVPKAFALAKKACDGGVGRGCYSLGYLYKKGLSVPADTKIANALFTKACAMNSGSGCFEIGNHAKACSLNDEQSCDVLCRAGNTASCAHASQEVKDEVAARESQRRAQPEPRRTAPSTPKGSAPPRCAGSSTRHPIQLGNFQALCEDASGGTCIFGRLGSGQHTEAQVKAAGAACCCEIR